MWFVLAAGCHHEVEFPAGLEPLEENLAPPPEGDEDWPESLSIVSGDDGDLHWTHARGYVRSAVEDVVGSWRRPGHLRRPGAG